MKWTAKLRGWLMSKLDPDYAAAHKEALAAEAKATTMRAAMDLLEDVECPFCGRSVPLDRGCLVLHDYVKLGYRRTCPCSGFTPDDAYTIAYDAIYEPPQPHPGQVAP